MSEKTQAFAARADAIIVECLEALAALADECEVPLSTTLVQTFAADGEGPKMHGVIRRGAMSHRLGDEVAKETTETERFLPPDLLNEDPLGQWLLGQIAQEQLNQALLLVRDMNVRSDYVETVETGNGKTLLVAVVEDYAMLSCAMCVALSSRPELEPHEHAAFKAFYDKLP